MSSFPVFDVAEVAQEASERAGIEFRSGYALRSARRSLELLLISWANRGLNLWTIEGPTSINLEPGVSQYFLPEDTVDLIEHAVRTWNLYDYGNAWGDWTPPPPGTVPPSSYNGWSEWRQSRYTDQPLDRMTIPEYAAIPNKDAQGRPTIIHIRRQIKPYFVIWMVPPPSPFYQLIIWRLRRMQSVGAGGTGQPEIPWRFVNAMIAGLAYHLALKSKDPQAVPRVQMLKAMYEEEFGLASDEDRDRAAIHWVPGGYERI